PPRPRSPLRHRLQQERARVGLAADHRLRGRPAANHRLVSRTQRLDCRYSHGRLSQILRAAIRHTGAGDTSVKRALITGITGQDGSYLAEWLLEQGYEVHGVVRRSSTEKFDRIAHLTDRLQLHQADLLDQLSLIEVLRRVRPLEVYNLAAM